MVKSSDFLIKLQTEDGLALNTIAAYGKDLELFEKFLDVERLTLKQVTTMVLKDYLFALHQQKLKATSVARKISCLKNFFKFLVNENFIKSNPATNLQTPKREAKIPKFLSEEEIFKLENPRLKGEFRSLKRLHFSRNSFLGNQILRHYKRHILAS